MNELGEEKREMQESVTIYPIHPVLFSVLYTSSFHLQIIFIFFIYLSSLQETHDEFKDFNSFPLLCFCRSAPALRHICNCEVDRHGRKSGCLSSRHASCSIESCKHDSCWGLRDFKHLYTKAGENRIIASGKLELAEFNEIFHTEIESPNNMVTIGGWLTQMQESRIPVEPNF